MSKDFFGHSVYFLTETPGERRLNPVTTAAGIFPALRRNVPPPLYFVWQNTGEEGNTFLCIVFILLPLLLGDTP